MTEDFPDEVAKLCCSHFAHNLSKKGKPQKDREWTPMAAVVMVTGIPGDMKVVAMGTGSKCLGASQLLDGGELVHDSHAEVMARSFLRCVTLVHVILVYATIYY